MPQAHIQRVQTNYIERCWNAHPAAGKLIGDPRNSTQTHTRAANPPQGGRKEQ
jgi:hypothetical protein